MARPPAGGGQAPLQKALQAVADVLADQIITSENDLVGVCLYGTEKVCTTSTILSTNGPNHLGLH